jgi:hypothetical protein
VGDGHHPPLLVYQVLYYDRKYPNFVLLVTKSIEKAIANVFESLCPRQGERKL